MAAPRSRDRGGHSGFPAGLAGDRQKAARQPSGKPLPTRKPAPNGAGGVGRGSHDTPHRHPVPGGRNRQEQDGDEGVGIPHGGAASCAAMGDSSGQRKTGGTPPVFLF
ncbi:hypothetical protein NDU88_001779 [Pleurodeles waltl]|uniref:Uncharacterized protein n=1 Tax=Pleurodeles waltl TaxID=8319 RepID=A0AAV7KR56_PLEWA|nr:hypothetical protein NDU88_001779 [Pleurodeles waltl]